MTPSVPFAEAQLLKRFVINGKGMDIGSDWHFDLQAPDIVRRILAHIKKTQRSTILLCMGDLFEVKGHNDSHARVLDLLRGFSTLYNHVVFTPGNHDLRGRDTPWQVFEDMPDNVLTPAPLQPIVWEHEGTRMLVANIFYDMRFLDPAVVDVTQEEVKKQYASSEDGHHFLSGDTTLFERMTEVAAQELTPDIHVITTHALPHPSFVEFKVDRFDKNRCDLIEEMGLHFTREEESDRLAAEKSGRSLQEYRRWFNAKCMYMGSNVIGHPLARPRDGLTAVFGHHHRNATHPGCIHGKTLFVATHQMVQKNPRYKVALPDVQ